MRGLFLACALLLLLQNSLGLWYGGPRPENLDYNTPAFQNTYFDNLPFATLSLKINRSIEDGPGQELVTDPLNSGRSLFVGNTINRETFETQFILDLEFSIGISPDRVYLSSIRPGDIIFSDETTSVIVDFIFLERNDTVSITMLEAISNLTVSIQDTNSSVYIGTNVTKYIDSFYGLDVLNWDVSLKLSYAIEVIGGNETIDGYFLNQGSQEICSTPLLYNYPVYCEFERYFVDDLSNALNISYSRIQVLFVKKAALDAVLIYFRIYPPIDPATETNTTLTIGNLILEVMDPTSALYQGNVTLHVDPTWGVSNSYVQPRSGQALFTWKYYEIDDSIVNLTSRARFNTPYDRCKANKRCNWGVIGKKYSTLLYLMGYELTSLSLFRVKSKHECSVILPETL